MAVVRVPRKDGTEHAFWFEHFLAKPAEEPQLAEDFRRVWLVGALLTLGDALDNEKYFDHAPELEMVRHLRNGVAHGNRFEITRGGREQLAQHPAHTRDASSKSDLNTVFEITPALDGQRVLFDFMGPADVLDLINSVERYLLGIGQGQPGHYDSRP